MRFEPVHRAAALGRVARLTGWLLVGLLIATDASADDLIHDDDAQSSLVGARSFVCLRDGDTLICEGGLFGPPHDDTGMTRDDDGVWRWRWRIDAFDELRVTDNLFCGRSDGEIRCAGEVAGKTTTHMQFEETHAVSCGDAWWISTGGYICQPCRERLVCERTFALHTDHLELAAPEQVSDVVAIATTETLDTDPVWVSMVYADGRVAYASEDSDEIVATLDTGLVTAITLSRGGAAFDTYWLCGLDDQGRLACADLLRCVPPKRGEMDVELIGRANPATCEPAVQPWQVELPDAFSPTRIRLDTFTGCAGSSTGEVRCWPRPRADAYDVSVESRPVSFTHEGPPDDFAVTWLAVCALFGDEIECVPRPSF